ncbi:MAG: HAD-IC family P-type ATPase, partial [Candidatus Hydrogenedentes bacterium]|nr:HAD-IC family P-type ATPase [Candidatus Hydrogenedentota bacterium]
MSKHTIDNRSWHAMTIEQIARELDADVDRGLNDEEVAARLNLYGPNKLTEHAGPSAWKIFAGQFADFIIWVLIGAAVISALLGEVVDSAAIFVIVVANAVLGFIQEYKAEQSLAALRKMANPVSRVIRSGETRQIPSDQLVPGDIIELESGDNIPADVRIVSNTANFAAQESALTGESVPVLKSSKPVAKADIPLGDRSSMLYMGTSVTAGKSRGLVVATGMRAELGKIAGLIQDIPREMTPLQKKLERFGKWIVYLSIGLVVVIFFMGLWRGYEVLWMFMTTVSLAVAAIPEGLPAVVTISLALGVQRMVRRHALIRKLPSVETLGCATVICSDKTGTLTRNEMTVQKIWVGGRLVDVTGTGYAPDGSFLADGREIDPATDPDLRTILVSASLCNGARLMPPVDDKSWHIVGDPTEGALLVAAAKAGLTLDKLETEFPLVEEYPFDSERKRMTILRRDADGVVAHVKGAPDVLLDRCTRIRDGGSDRDMTDADRTAILDINDKLASQAMRVLAVARRDLADGYKADGVADIEQDLVFLGLVGMIDPARPEVREAIERCHHAGIRPVMITGDHLTTAVAVAKEVGSFDAEAEAFTGADINRMDDDELFNEVEKIAVYARVSAEHKLRIVRAWRKRGHVVAMTGDGVNDAPALKEADIGVAMGITGTDVTKEVADMVVTDDNFASIVNAVEEGRGIYDNIKKFVNYLL